MGNSACFQDDLKLLPRDFMPLNVTAGFGSELICHVTLAQKKLVVLGLQSHVGLHLQSHICVFP